VIKAQIDLPREKIAEFDPDHIPGLIRLTGMELELTELLGRKAVHVS